MKKLLLALVLLGGAFSAASAAELKVMTVGLVGNGFRALTAAWSASTGNTVTLVIPPSALDQVLEAMKTRDADAVLLPMNEMPGQGAYFAPGTVRPIGRVLFGLGVRKGAPDLPVAGEAQFKAALAGKTVLINDPASSLNGRMARAMLDGAGFETVTVRGIYASASVLARGEGDYVVTVLPELSALKVLGEVPPSLGLRIDFGGGWRRTRRRRRWRRSSWPISPARRRRRCGKPAGSARRPDQGRGVLLRPGLQHRYCCVAKYSWKNQLFCLVPCSQLQQATPTSSLTGRPQTPVSTHRTRHLTGRNRD